MADAYLVEQVVVLLLQVSHHLCLRLVFRTVLAELLLQAVQFPVGVLHLAFQLYHLLSCLVLLHDYLQLYSVYLQAHIECRIKNDELRIQPAAVVQPHASVAPLAVGQYPAGVRLGVA